tara:strand:- start:17367 stop:19418 length:2052 start_codon:yes stop_codon:yes gene_type:complete
MNVKKPTFLVLLSIFVLSACAHIDDDRMAAPDSYLKSTEKKNDEGGRYTAAAELSENISGTSKELSYIPSLVEQKKSQSKVIDLTAQFSEKDMVELTVDGLPLKDFLHYVMGEILAVSYILGEEAETDDQTVTLNLQNRVSKRKLFSLTEELLSQRGYVVRYNDNVYYIHKAEGTGSKPDIAYGYGNTPDDVPQTSQNIIQLVPYTYGAQHEVVGVLNRILNVVALPDGKRNAVSIKGKRQDIIKALEFIDLMDQPALKNRKIGVYQATYVSTADLLLSLPKLLKQEGISADDKGSVTQAVSFVSIERAGLLIIFSNSRQLIERVSFWAKKIDQPTMGNERQYHIYQPKFARATDLGESLQILIGGGTGISNSTSAENQNNKGSEVQSKTASVVSGGGLKLVIDERSNMLIFESSGEKYRQLLPIIERLDVMPKQVMLEVMIAEVKLTDEFKNGVSFELTNKGSADITGNFNLANTSSGLSYVLTGARGNLTIDLFQKNVNVNVLSRPSLVVRDGVEANITVGDDIPTVGEIITDPVNGSKTSVVYRKTGVQLSVVPTINAQGVVIMEISQKISNQAPGDSSVAGSPIIFERSITTEVVAASGQTVILGGLISEDRTVTDRRIPFFSSIPILGRLFDSSDDSKNKTELVVMVTPRVLESSDEWELIKRKLSSKLQLLDLKQKN